MGIMIFMLKSQRRAFRWPNNMCARQYNVSVQLNLIFNHILRNATIIRAFTCDIMITVILLIKIN